MGDKDGAREILQEVIKEGDAEQQAQAKKLLDSSGLAGTAQPDRTAAVRAVAVLFFGRLQESRMRIALGLEYDGSRFCGWQTQPRGCGCRTRSSARSPRSPGEPVATICAGRTDAGVHALAQVVHFDTARGAAASRRGCAARTRCCRPRLRGDAGRGR